MSEPPGPLSVGTLLRYLAFDRAAIETVARSPWSCAVGALLVIAGGLARHGDASDLFHQPWLVLRPMAASLVVSGSIFLVVHLTTWIRLGRQPGRPPFAAAYRSFLGLFWMTAPMALLYAIPFERLFEAYGATAANIVVLLIVSIWRVALMARVVSVRYQFHPFCALCLVMAVADIAAIVGLSHAPVPVMTFMGGMQPSASDALIAETAMGVMFLAMLSLPIWIVGVFGILICSSPSWPTFPEPTTTDASAPPTLGLRVLVAALLLAWVPLLPITQPPRIRAWHVDRWLRAGEIELALAELSSFDRGDFPSDWLPPPRISRRERQPPIADVLRAIDQESTPPWVIRHFVDEGWRSLHMWGWRLHGALIDGDHEELDGLVGRFDEQEREVLRFAVELDDEIDPATRLRFQHAIDRTPPAESRP